MSSSTTPALRVVSDPVKPRTETEEKLWQALSTRPGSTAAALSAAAGIGKSTAAKILSRWERDGLATRSSGIGGSGPRPADRWSIALDEQPADDEPTGEQPVVEAGAAANGKAEPGGEGRLAPGALRGMVEDYLREHPREAYSPNAIGKALNRSAGAVHNALEKLVAGGCAVRTGDKPKKYSLAPVEAADPGK